MDSTTTTATYLPIALLADLVEDRPAHAEADGIDLVLVRRGPDVHVFEGRCPHRGALLADGRIPVVSSVAAGRDGEVYNVNADTAAAALAVALDAAKLVVLTDVAGLYRDWPSSADVISELTAAELERLLPGLSAGMIPKMEACLTAVRGGVPQAHVLDGRLSHAVLLEIFTDSGIGTMVLPGDN